MEGGGGGGRRLEATKVADEEGGWGGGIQLQLFTLLSFLLLVSHRSSLQIKKMTMTMTMTMIMTISVAMTISVTMTFSVTMTMTISVTLYYLSTPPLPNPQKVVGDTHTTDGIT